MSGQRGAGTPFGTTPTHHGPAAPGETWRTITLCAACTAVAVAIIAIPWALTA